MGPGDDGGGGGGEAGARKGSGSSGRPGAGVNVETAVGEPGARGASADLGGDGLNLSVQAGSASGSRAAGSGGAPGTQSGWSREARPPLPPARSPLPPVRGAPPLPHPSPPTRLSGRGGGWPAAARGAPGPGGAAAAASAPAVAQQPHELADLRVEGPGRLTVRVADLVLEELVAAAALRGRAPHLLAGQRGRHAAVGGQRLAAV